MKKGRIHKNLNIFKTRSNCYLDLGIEFFLFVSHGGMNDRGSTCKFRNARSAFRNLHVDPLSFIPPWETSRIQSLYLYFIKIVPFCLWNIRFLIHNRAVFRTAAGTARSYVTGTPSWKNGCQNFSYVHRSRKHLKCKYFNLHFKFIQYTCRTCMCNKEVGTCTCFVPRTVFKFTPSLWT